MGRFQSGPFVVITTFSIGPVGVENIVITTKGLQDRNNLLLDGRTVENKGKIILTIVMVHFNSILFHKSGPANKQHTYLSINQSINQKERR